VCKEVRATPTIVKPLAKTLDSERIFGFKRLENLINTLREELHLSN